MMSTTGDRVVGTPKLRVWSVLMRRAPNDRDAYIEYFARVFRMIGSPAYRAGRASGCASSPARPTTAATHPAGTARQLAAILASGSRTAALRRAGRARPS